MSLLLALLAFSPVHAKKPSLDGKTLSAADALGSKCDASSVSGMANPFVVDWDDMQRANLETAMKNDGVVVVKYDCGGFTVLPSCKVPGNYTYSGVSPKTKVIEMKDAASVQANFGSFVSPVKFKGAFEQGHALNLAYMMVGTNTTTVNQISGGDLKGDCSGATHFVSQAYLGAFVLDSASQGSARAAVEVFNAGGASVGASQSKMSAKKDGSLASCKQAGEDDATAKSGCKALLRLQIMPLAGMTSTGVVDARACPSGFVYSDGQCSRRDEVENYLCAPGDLLECKEQCNAGSSESCNRFAGLLLDNYIDQDARILRFKKGAAKELARDVNDNLNFEVACMDGEPNACTIAAVGVSLYHGKIEDFNNAKASIMALPLFETACRGGEAYACTRMNELLVSGTWHDEDEPEDMRIMMDIPRAAKALESACASGSARSCLLLAENYSFDSDFEELYSKPERALRAEKALTNACHGGRSDACVMAAAANAPGSACQSTVDWMTKKMGSDYYGALYLFQEDEYFCPVTESLSNITKSRELAQYGCSKGNEMACGLIKKLSKIK